MVVPPSRVLRFAMTLFTSAVVTTLWASTSAPTTPTRLQQCYNRLLQAFDCLMFTICKDKRYMVLRTRDTWLSQILLIVQESYLLVNRAGRVAVLNSCVEYPINHTCYCVRIVAPVSFIFTRPKLSCYSTQNFPYRPSLQPCPNISHPTDIFY